MKEFDRDLCPEGELIIMTVRLLLLCLLLSLPLSADQQADYDRLKTDIAEQKRTLSKFEKQGRYTEAIPLQDSIAKLAQSALDIALASPEIGDASAYSYYVGVLKDVGKTEQALAALGAYQELPLLERDQLVEVWRKRAEIYRKAGDDRALDSYRKGAEATDKPRERGWFQIDAARMLVDLGRPDEALAEISKLPQLIATLEPAQQESLERDRQSVLEKAYREKGDAALAREAKKREIELRLLVLQRELAEFDQKYPISSK